MISTPHVIETTAQEAAVIQLSIARSAMMREFGPAVAELLAALHAQGIEPIGAVFAHHLKMTSDTFDFELGIKVATPVKENGRVKPGSLPAVKVARTVYSGPYEGLPDAWKEFSSWIRTNGLSPAPDLWELYSVGPQSSPSPAEWRTELNQPLLA
ncbi:MAG: GyrI-like domain-containing protein [Pseudomonadota bacterium]